VGTAKLKVTVKMAAALLEPGDVIALYSGDDEAGMAIVTEPMRHDPKFEMHAVGTTEGRFYLKPEDEATVKAYGAFRELGKQGARKMTWSAILDPTPLMLEETERGLPRAARAYLIRLRSEDGFAADLKRRKAIEAVLWHYGHDKGLEPGEFTKSLIEALFQADSENFTRLALGFPDLALAVWLAKNTPTGTEDLATTLRVADLMTEVNELAAADAARVPDPVRDPAGDIPPGLQDGQDG